MRCPSSDRVGAKPPSRAIARRGCSGSGRKRAAQTRAPDPGRLDPAVLDCLAHAGMPRSHRLPTARRSRAKARQQPTAGIEGPTTVLADRRGEARKRFPSRIGWQKSTSGAWPRARAGEEPALAAGSSLLPSWGSGRKSVGSRAAVAKPLLGGGLALEAKRSHAEPSEHSSMEGAWVRRQAATLTSRGGRSNQFAD